MSGRGWIMAGEELASARQALLASPEGIARQVPYDRLLAAQRRCTGLIHEKLAAAAGLARVVEPRAVLSLDIDGVLEEERDGISSTGLTGAAALRLLQRGGVAVLLNSGRSIADVADRAAQLELLGGVAGFGAAVWDGVFGRELTLLSDRASAQLDQLRGLLRADPTVVQDSNHPHVVRVSRCVDGVPGPIPGTVARQILDQHGLYDLTFWVAPGYTDFVDRSVDKGIGIRRLQQELGLSGVTLAALGDGTCDLPMLKCAELAFLPAASAPGYIPVRRQRLQRSRHLGERALWDAACSLVPDLAIQRAVLDAISEFSFPDWFPLALLEPPRASSGLLPRLAARWAHQGRPRHPSIN
jgi:haloacid dehalogenase-like hydrolase